MRLWIGTSGYSYREWQGDFYPARIPAREMLGYYAQRLPSVEINQTFYRMPRREAAAAWAAQVPEGFRFAVKAPRRITHLKRLRDVEKETTALLEALAGLGPRFGRLLVQLPPDFALDAERLAHFLELVPPRWPLALEFRHESWAADDVERLLAARGAARVHADTDAPASGAAELAGGPARCGYLRLRREQYSAQELEAWARRIRAQPWSEAFVFFKHEREGPARALALRAAFEQAGPRAPDAVAPLPAAGAATRLSGPRR